MPRAIVTIGFLFFVLGSLGANGQESGERRPDIKITRDRKNKDSTRTALAPDEDKPKKRNKNTVSAEDAQVIAHIELLQNLELLQNYDKATLLRLFTSDDADQRTRSKATRDQRKGHKGDEKNNKY